MAKAAKKEGMTTIIWSLSTSELKGLIKVIAIIELIWAALFNFRNHLLLLLWVAIKSRFYPESGMYKPIQYPRQPLEAQWFFKNLESVGMPSLAILEPISLHAPVQYPSKWWRPGVAACGSSAIIFKYGVWGDAFNSHSDTYQPSCPYPTVS